VRGGSCLEWGKWVSSKKVLEDGKTLFGFVNKTLNPSLKLSQISSLCSLVPIFNPYEKV